MADFDVYRLSESVVEAVFESVLGQLSLVVLARRIWEVEPASARRR